MNHEKVPTLYLNENISIRLLFELQKFNIPAVHTIQAGNRGISDMQQLKFACQNNYVLVTHNRNHFRRLHYEWKSLGEKHPGILLVKFGDVDIIAKRIEKFIRIIYPNVEESFCLSPPNVDSYS